MIRSVLGSRASIGGVLGSGRGAATAEWWLSGGVSAANAIAVYQPIGAASLAASYTNLANPGTYNAAPGVAPTWDTTGGWNFGTKEQYLDSGIVPGNDYSAIVRLSNANDGYVLGQQATNAQLGIAPARSGSRIYHHQTFLQVGTAQTSGVFALCGASAAYFNGTFEGALSAWTGTTSYTIYLGGYNNVATSAWFTGKIQAIAIYNTTLTAPQVAAISSAMSAL